MQKLIVTLLVIATTGCASTSKGFIFDENCKMEMDGMDGLTNGMALASSPTNLKRSASKALLASPKKHSSEQYTAEGARIMDAIEDTKVTAKILDEPNYDGLNQVQQLEAQCRYNKAIERLKATSE